MGEKRHYKIRTSAKDITTTVVAQEHQLIMDEPLKFGGSDKGPTPLHAILGTLASCESITAFAAAKAMKLNIEELTFEVIGELDPRGMKGDPNVKTYFEKVEMTIKIKTTEPIENIHKLKDKVEERCPVYNLFKAADVKVIQRWEKVE
ncbi:OsmC family protein [Bacillus suaedaesalsae]|uniref:OsmC family protein n=1 Tax=Bacillus suaedaesalsae TaxID=2810349 RepID=A0ABS2DGW1_9BACI|nr:OsmC family protein [Bacillus suaedaesalsae]MBM6617656.1 OsmC family protein [Bacillus suaedaesalsae]